jgi:hypothetical protein
MADCVYVRHTLLCPHCGEIVTNEVAFQWRYCLGPDGPPGGDYSLGDTIRWRQCTDGSIPEWSYFKHGGRHAGGNIGDPACRNLITRGTHYGFLYNWQNEPDRRRCPHCHEVLEGIAIEIRDTALARVWLYSPGEFTGQADYCIVRSDRRLRAMPEWDSRSMPIRADCF